MHCIQLKSVKRVHVTSCSQW